MRNVGNLYFSYPAPDVCRAFFCRLKDASGPDRDLDAAIREFELVCDPVLNPIEPPPPPPHYTSDIEEAKRFVEHVAPEYLRLLSARTIADLTAFDLVVVCSVWLMVESERSERHQQDDRGGAD